MNTLALFHIYGWMIHRHGRLHPACLWTMCIENPKWSSRLSWMTLCPRFVSDLHSKIQNVKFLIFYEKICTQSQMACLVWQNRQTNRKLTRTKSPISSSNWNAWAPGINKKIINKNLDTQDWWRGRISHTEKSPTNTNTTRNEPRDVICCDQCQKNRTRARIRIVLPRTKIGKINLQMNCECKLWCETSQLTHNYSRSKPLV